MAFCHLHQRIHENQTRIIRRLQTEYQETCRLHGMRIGTAGFFCLFPGKGSKLNCLI